MKKIRIPLYIQEETANEIKEFTDAGYAKSRNDFINKAITFYLGYLRNNKNIDYIAPILSSVMKSQMQSTEKILSENIFKLAVEVSKLNCVVASTYRLKEETLEKINNKCCESVASNNGVIHLREADWLVDDWLNN